MAQLIANEKAMDVTPNDGESFSLDELQGFVGGYIEVVYLPDGKFLIVNEEGLIKRMPLNRLASTIAGRTLVGPAVLCNGREFR